MTRPVTRDYEAAPYADWSYSLGGELVCQGCDEPIVDHCCHDCEVVFLGERPVAEPVEWECLSCGRDCRGACDAAFDLHRDAMNSAVIL